MKMKPIFLFLLLAVFSSSKIVGQEDADSNKNGVAATIEGASSKISIGPTIGLNITNLSGNPENLDLNAASGAGVRLGLASNFHFGRLTDSSDGGTGKYGMQLEAVYSQQKADTDLGNVNLSYLDVPILAQYNFPKGNNFFVIEAGPTFSLLLSSSPDKIGNANAAIHIGELKGSDLKLTFGLGFKSKKGFFANARYYLGTSKLAGNFPVKTNIASVSLGWLLFSILK